jgi:DnaJ-class molecular chaperone
MICNVCDGKGIVPADAEAKKTKGWNGEERRQQGRGISNEELKFREAVPAALYESCERCQGSGKLHPNLLYV